MLTKHLHTARRWNVSASILVFAFIVAAISFTYGIAADPSPAAQTEQWGAEVEGLCTRLVPLEKQYVLGQPMKIQLEMKNVGQHKVNYDPQQVDVNNPLEVLDPQGKPVGYIGYRGQTMSGKGPSLAPGSRVILCECDLASLYFIAKPGKYTIRRKQDWGMIPASSALTIDVQPGPLPPAWHVALRLCDILPEGWELTQAQSEPSKIAPPGWETGQRIFSIRAICSKYQPILIRDGRGVQADFWISDSKLEWTGKIDSAGDRAAFYLGKCPEGYVYASLPSYVEANVAKWDHIEKDVEKALQVVSDDYPILANGGVHNDDDLRHHEGLSGLDSLDLDNTEITDAGLKHLEGLTRLKTLWLRRTRITDQGLQSLKKLPQLENVWFDGDNITDAGLENLKGLTQLQGLSLDATKITDGGLKKLKELARLEYLSLGETPITDAALETVKGFTLLRSLDLNGTRITDAGVQHIQGLTKIKRLSLANTEITDAGLEHLKGLTDLTSLDLDKTHVTDQGVKMLQQIVPGCEFLRQGWIL